ncbi:hypothetical protein M5K25_022041 [Dendrobium thyrsiflorum]|uniref:Uncharacterized protein n=1 Tax=Dendrobium thyrsiflorum TaxID=117978 RepID=A0ABD0U5H4_DENTH
MAGTTSSIISNLLSSLERLSKFMPTITSLVASSSSSSSSIEGEDVMAGTTSSISSNLLSSLKRLSQFKPIFTSLAAFFSSSSSSIVREEVMAAQVNSIHERLMEDLSRLSRMLRRIQAVLHDAEEREINDKAIQLWLNELREVAYDVEYVLDQYDYQVIKIQVEGMTVSAEAEPSLKRKRVDDGIYGCQVTPPPSNSIKIPISCNMAKRIIEIIKKFDEITNDRKALKLREEDAPRRPYFNNVMKRTPSSSLVHESDVFGREKEKREIIQLLTSHSKKESIVIPIFGMGGVGKTTLAQLVYNDPEDALLNKNFLLVLDDVWNEKADMWEALRAPFSGIEEGKIIVTTRSMLVARIMQTVPTLELGCLDDEKSWLLFQRHAFCGWEPDLQKNFEQIGRGITMKCGGLPLALKVIGGFLRYEVKVQIWKDVLNNHLWELEETKSLILPALRISYNHLPAYLKPCFLYASLFPKDYHFRKVELTKMWIAQGYIHLTGRKRLLEDISLEYIEELVRRSFFQCSKYNNKFTLHDMVHDLAQSITKNEICSSLDSDELKNIPKDAKHVFIKETKVDQVLSHGNIRTLCIDISYCFSAVLHQNIFSKIPMSHLGCLRVFRFHVPNFKCSSEVIDSIGNMHLLRYLYIFVNTIQMTENSLCRLYKLQTLILKSFHINMVPHTFEKLINLRNLVIQSEYQELVPKSYFGSKNLLSFSFSNLTLTTSEYHVRRDGPNSNIRWLKPLTNLRRSLKIHGLENVVDHEDAKSANLYSKPYIDSLILIWKYSKYDECARNDEAILEGLQPHTNLKELTIHGYNGNSFPCWFGNPHFSNLTKIRLRNFSNTEECKFLPLSKLPSLTSLEMSNNGGIARMGQDFWCYNAPLGYLENYSIEAHEWKEHPMVKNGDFSSLKCLYLTYCKMLQHISTLPSSLEEILVRNCGRLEYIELPYSSGHLSRLQKVKIYYCRNLKSVINLNNLHGTLKHLELVKCDMLKLDPDEDFDNSFERVSFDEGINASVIGCPGMRKWCQWYGFSYENSYCEGHDDPCDEDMQDWSFQVLDEFPPLDSLDVS